MYVTRKHHVIVWISHVQKDAYPINEQHNSFDKV